MAVLHKIAVYLIWSNFLVLLNARTSLSFAAFNHYHPNANIFLQSFSPFSISSILIPKIIFTIPNITMTFTTLKIMDSYSRNKFHFFALDSQQMFQPFLVGVGHPVHLMKMMKVMKLMTMMMMMVILMMMMMMTTIPLIVRVMTMMTTLIMVIMGKMMTNLVVLSCLFFHIHSTSTLAL